MTTTSTGTIRLSDLFDADRRTTDPVVRTLAGSALALLPQSSDYGCVSDDAADYVEWRHATWQTRRQNRAGDTRP